MSVERCPPDDVIAAFVAGTLEEGERAAVVEHVAGCSSCSLLVARSAPEEEEEHEPGARIDRYHVLGVAGRGATGLVYAAYDPRLDRKVALKVLRRPAPELEARLAREARAMARVSSAHVVAVHDVGTFDGGVYVAMDFVEGPTLRRWLAAAPRGWREVVAVFVQAGRGLAAAHAEGIVHRDFKPDNVLVGDGGARVAVTDFGLARAPAPAAPPPADTPLDLTATGTLVGTPAYMAPEALRREPVDARADIYSFSAALFEALYGRLPFVARDLNGLIDAAGRGAIDVPREPSIPPHLRAAVLAGLSPDPARRPPSMAALLRALERDPRRRAGRAALGGAAALVIAAAALLLPRAPAAPVCRGAEGRLAGLWDGARREALRQAFARTGSPLAAEAASGVERAFDAYAARWTAAHTEACEATQLRREASEALMDRRMACLEERRARWAVFGDLLAHIEAADVAKAPSAAWDLPRIEPCAGDPGADPAPAPAFAPLVVLARAAVARARADWLLGRQQQGLADLAPALAVARATAYRPLEAESRLAEGALRSASDPRAAEEALHAASVAAEAAGRIDLVADADLRLARNVGFDQNRTGESLRLADHAEAAIERLGDPLLRGDLASARGAIYNASATRPRAEGLLREALRIYDAQLGPDHPRTALTLNHLAIALAQAGRLAEALPLFERALAARVTTLGSDHPDTLAVRANVALALRQLGRHREALSAQQAVVASVERVTGPSSLLLSAGLLNLALIEEDLDHLEEAAAAARRSLEIDERLLGRDDARLINALGVLAQILASRDDAAGALDAAGRAVVIAEAKLAPDHPALRGALQQRGLVLAGSGRCGDAERDLERARKLWGDEPDAGFTLDALGRCALLGRRAREAEALHLQAIAVREKALGPDHPFLTDSLGGLARARLALGQGEAAREAARRAVAILEKAGQAPAKLASARLILAEVTWPADRAGARAQAERALDDLRDLPVSTTRHEVETWLRAHR